MTTAEPRHGIDDVWSNQGQHPPPLRVGGMGKPLTHYRQLPDGGYPRSQLRGNPDGGPDFPHVRREPHATSPVGPRAVRGPLHRLVPSNAGSPVAHRPPSPRRRARERHRLAVGTSPIPTSQPPSPAHSWRWYPVDRFDEHTWVPASTSISPDPSERMEQPRPRP